MVYYRKYHDEESDAGVTTAPVRVGIVGLGAIGQRLIKAFREEPGAHISYVVDVDAALAERTASDLGGIAQHTDYRAMLEGDQVDLVYVAVPPRYHHRISLDVLAAHKHILCEKPLAQTLLEAKEMTARAEEAGVVHALNLPLHYNSGIRTFSEQVRAGALGHLRRAEISLLFPQWPRAWQMTPWVGQREQGGPIREVGPHLINVILRNFGPVARVRADMEYPADPKACEIGALGLLQLASGQHVSVNALCNLPRPESVSLTAFGTEGTLALQNWANPMVAKGLDPLQPITVLEAAPGLIPNLIKAVRGEPADLCGFDDGLQIQAVLDAWERAAESGRWVDVVR